MNLYDLLIIDPQNDFLDIPGAALPVPGAAADMQRLADWLVPHAAQVRSITVTLDSHASVGVERTTFWLRADGAAVAPFTVITAAELARGDYRPRNPALLGEVHAYLQALEASGQRQLVVWPVHCVLGTWGHNIHSGLSEALAAWELATGQIVNKVLKGQNPLTEQYSAFKAEVPRADDARSLLNKPLIQALSAQGATLLIAGEASSHCVAASVADLIDTLPAARLQGTVLLTDCMSPVTGFETAVQEFLARASAAGIKAGRVASLA
ncbi:isochorismatase family protein [Rhodoferax sp.]|uniref:isochorismatase family protein n=1 Tax=Rhodoferax sp. TaxID=50421 RepID=UPI0025CBA2DB|nr:isochorismatase family protein [Rhodoferax sp.]